MELAVNNYQTVVDDVNGHYIAERMCVSLYDFNLAGLSWKLQAAVVPDLLKLLGLCHIYKHT